MAAEDFEGVCFAIDVQDSGYGTPDSTIGGLSGTIDETDGCVLGDKNSGDAESGIVLPTLVRSVREVAQVSGSFTQSADSYLKTLADGMSITIPIQGNGATSTPSAGEAIPDLGIQALWRLAGMTGANGAASPDYKFTPTTGTATTYGTIKLWVGDLSFVFSDCLVDSTQIVFTPGGNGLATFNIAVGTHDPDTDFADGVTFPTVTYGTQASLSAPTVEGVAFTWGTGHPNTGSGFNTLTINISQNIEDIQDSNVETTGLLKSQTNRIITVDGTLFVDTADSDYDYQALVSSSAPTDDLSFQLGTAETGGGGETINAALINVNNLEAKSIKYNRLGTLLAVELSGAKATATSAGAEFMIEYN